MTGILTNLNRIIINRPLLLLISLFLIVQTALFMRIGVFTELEAQKYVTQGNLLYETGRISATKYIFYLPVILLVYLCRLLGTSYHLVVLVQITLSAFSLFCYYKLGKGIGNAAIAFYSSVLLILFIPLQIWNFYLYSDSIFISLSIIYTYVIYRYEANGLSGTISTILLLAVLVFSRPAGLLFVPPTMIYLLFRNQSKKQLAINAGACLALLVCTYFLFNKVFTGGEDMDAMKPFIEEHIICFVPLKPEGAMLDVIRTNNPVNDIFYYITNNPLHFSRMTMLRLFSFFNLTRSFYSTTHNVLLSLFIIPVYVFAIVGLIRCSKPFRNFMLFLVSLLILYPLGTTLQCDDWHSRFTMVVFPYFILLACIGFKLLIGKKSPNS